jgi:hypothetical protein
VAGCNAVQVKIAFMNTQMVCQLLIINLLILSSFSTKKESGFTARGPMVHAHYAIASSPIHD